MTVTIDDIECYLFAECCKYNGKWYISDFGGLLGDTMPSDVVEILNNNGGLMLV